MSSLEEVGFHFFPGRGQRIDGGPVSGAGTVTDGTPNDVVTIKVVNNESGDEVYVKCKKWKGLNDLMFAYSHFDVNGPVGRAFGEM